MAIDAMGLTRKSHYGTPETLKAGSGHPNSSLHRALDVYRSLDLTRYLVLSILMGSMLSHPSFEWAVAAGIAGAVTYSYLTYSSTGAPSSAGPSTSGDATATAGGKSGKGKKKKQTLKHAGVSEPSEKPVSTTTTRATITATTATAASAHGNPVPEPTVVPFPHVIPGEFDAVGVLASSEDESSQAKKNKGTKKKQKKKQKQKQQTETEKEKGTATGAALDVEPQPSGQVHVPGTSTSPSPSIDMPSGEMFSPKADEERHTPHIRSSSPSFDTDSSWTRIDTRQTAARGAKTAPGTGTGTGTGSDDQILAITTDMTSSDVGPSTGDSAFAERTDEDEDVHAHAHVSVSDRDSRRTLAERLLPKPRKTAVDDMLERPDYPGLARVMRVHPRADEAPAPGFSWKDYEDVDDGSGTVNDADGEGDGEWGIVKGKGRSKVSRPSTTPSQVNIQQAPELTKKQRQNAKRNQMLKDAKADAEAERLVKLAERRRAMEREQIIDQSRRGGGKQTSGGMQATVDNRGKLVWD